MIKEKPPQLQLLIMKNLAKLTNLTFAILAFTLLFTACRKDDDTPQPEQVAKEITAEELENYIIVEEYLPKASASAEHGDKPILITASVVNRNVTTNQFSTAIRYASVTDNTPSQTTYDASTGITSVKTVFGYYDFTRDASGQIVVIKSRHNDNSIYYISNMFDTQHIQLVKRTQASYDNTSYKNLTGTGYYRFRNSDNKWRWKKNAVPSDAEMTWTYYKSNNNDWQGRDDGSAQYHNLFVIIPKGNGWKGQHKDKDLLLINTMDNIGFRSVGDIGVYEVNN